eukprot:NODE_594_length_859_cov_926.066667_g448_i0.p2 GENE.NODE_594_length_859_cov_926.066667_g448_i0~~NODE_594_length_859_cov_926.066667_g448_i0.p2  ORF type:complete len:106 (-),score=4.06 NODE_594_length_859_cov_926.066667_g448_i0:231-548(-)
MGLLAKRPKMERAKSGPVQAAVDMVAVVAEDNDINRNILCSILRKEGCAVFEAVNGEVALDIVRTGEQIDAVFMDLSMPGTAIRMCGELTHSWLSWLGGEPQRTC